MNELFELLPLGLDIIRRIVESHKGEKLIFKVSQQRQYLQSYYRQTNFASSLVKWYQKFA